MRNKQSFPMAVAAATRNGCSYCSALRYAGGSNSLSGLDLIAGLTVTMGP